MSILESILTSPLGKKVTARAGLAEPPVLRRGRVPATGPVALASLPGAGPTLSALTGAEGRTGALARALVSRLSSAPL